MLYFIKTGFWEKNDKGFKGWLNLNQLIESLTNLPVWGTFTGTLSNQTDLQTALDTKQTVINTAVVLVDAASMDLTSTKHTLSSSSATRTFTITYTGDDITLIVTLANTAATYTFPATALCVSEGVASGDNLLALSGASGDKYIIGIKKVGNAYYIVSKNFGQ